MTCWPMFLALYVLTPPPFVRVFDFAPLPRNPESEDSTMIFGLIPRKPQPAPDPLTRPAPVAEGGFARLRQACADALASIAGAAPARQAALREERFNPRPLVERPVANQRVNPLLSASTGQNLRTARVAGWDPSAAPVMPSAAPAESRLRDWMPKQLDR